MALTIAEAYVQIKPTVKGIKSEISRQMGGDAEQAGDEAGTKMGNSLVGKLKGIIVAAGIGTIVKSALDAGGDLQQSFGGLDTLYEDAAEQAKQYAREAAAAGLSMNDYAETAVSMGAALKNSLGGDATAAAEKANTAIMDMTDNAAKMGTSVESLQNAYVGFSRGNFTMLDNLSLGFAGTKEGMQELLDKAQEISGVEYDIDSYADIVDAIHVVQDEMGIMGVAADEAKTTFSGSMAAMKASVTNLLADLTSGNDIEEDVKLLTGNLQTFLIDNLVPMLSNLLLQLPTLLKEGISLLISSLNMVSDNADTIIQMGLDLIGTLIVGLLNSLPALTKSVLSLIKSIAIAFKNYDWKTLGKNILEGIKNGIVASVKLVVEAAKSAAKSIFDAVKSFFIIGSPSRLMADEIGKWIPAGVAVGIEGNMDALNQSIDDMTNTTLNTALSARDFGYSPRTISSSDSGIAELVRALSNNSTNVTVKLEGDAQKLFRSTVSANNDYRKRTGMNAFA